MSEPIFLKALACRNDEGRPPVWLMRQAGRYLPEYQNLRQKHSLYDLFHTPKLAAEITLQPVKRFPVDAAILFSDILIVLESLGFSVDFPEGKNPCAKHTGVTKSLDFVGETIALVKSRCEAPLIGFCGGPYTVAKYIEGNIDLDRLTERSIEFLRMQERAGVDAFQIFDSWAGLLPKERFQTLSLNYLKKLLRAVSKPIILFTRNSSSYAEELAGLNPAGISFDGLKPMSELRKITPAHIAVQGNIEPTTLLGSKEEVIQAADQLLQCMTGEPGFIANLGHGVLKSTPMENVEAFVHHFAHGGIEQRMASGLPFD